MLTLLHHKSQPWYCNYCYLVKFTVHDIEDASSPRCRWDRLHRRRHQMIQPTIGNVCTRKSLYDDKEVYCLDCYCVIGWLRLLVFIALSPWSSSLGHGTSVQNWTKVLGPKLIFAKCDKHYPSRSRQTGPAIAVANFTKHVTKINFGPSSDHTKPQWVIIFYFLPKIMEY